MRDEITGEEFIVEFIRGQRRLEPEIQKALNEDFLELYDQHKPDPPTDIKVSGNVITWRKRDGVF